MALIKNYPTSQEITLEDGTRLSVSIFNIVEEVSDKLIKNHAIESIRRAVALKLRDISEATARAQEKRRLDQIEKTGESNVEPAWPNAEDKAVWKALLDTLTVDEKGKKHAKFTFDLKKYHEEAASKEKKEKGRPPVTEDDANEAYRTAFYALQPTGTEEQFAAYVVQRVLGRPSSDIELALAEVPEGETKSGEPIAA